MREIVKTPNAPAAIGPYSQAVKANGFVYASGQIAIDPATNEVMAGGIREQTGRVLKNLRELLEASGRSLDRVVKTTVFLTDMADYPAMNEEYAKFFAANPPARAALAVAGLPKNVLVEIDAVALTD